MFIWHLRISEILVLTYFGRVVSFAGALVICQNISLYFQLLLVILTELIHVFKCHNDVSKFSNPMIVFNMFSQYVLILVEQELLFFANR